LRRISVTLLAISFAIVAYVSLLGVFVNKVALAIVVWLVAWAVLHARWRDRDVGPARVGALTLILVALGIRGTFPTFWGQVS
jgi:hypothetical protein